MPPRSCRPCCSLTVAANVLDCLLPALPFPARPCTQVGPDAAEIMQGLGVAVKMGVTKAQLDSTVGIHPSGEGRRRLLRYRGGTGAV